MKYLLADVYGGFECIGGDCPNSCCIGWNVYIDGKTYDKYSSLKEPLRTEICSRIHSKGEKHVIVMDEDTGRCPFLNEHNLCDIYAKVSPEDMSYTCQVYPRYIFSVGDMTVCSMRASCPEVARMICRDEPMQYFFYEDDDSVAVSNEADWDLFNELINGFVLADKIIGNKKYSLNARIYALMSVARLLQDGVDRGMPALHRGKLEALKNDMFFSEYMRNKSNEYNGDFISYDKARAFVKMFEIMGKCWIGDVKEEVLSVDKEAWDNAIEQTNETYETGKEYAYENLMSLMLLEYFMRAVKSKEVVKNVKLAVIGIKAVQMYVLAKAAKMTNPNIEAILIEGMYEMSRSFEHSGLIEAVANKVDVLML